MSKFRDIRDRARRSIHANFEVAAIYIDPEDDSEIELTIRTHHRTHNSGDVSGYDYGPAERVETVPEIVALAEAVNPKRLGVFSLAADEAYRVETVMPVDGITVTTQVVRLRQSDIDEAGYPVP